MVPIIALMKKLVVGLQLLLVLLLIEAAAGRHIVRVSIMNDISPDAIISVDCESKQGNIPNHTLRYEEVLRFSFRPNIWGTTSYFCYFHWGRNKQAMFDVFTEGMCLACTWYAQKDFICLLNQQAAADESRNIKGWSIGPPPFKNICQSWIGINPPPLTANATTAGDIAA